MAAISVVQTIEAATSTDATSHATAILTPGAAGHILVLACHHTAATTATAMTAPTGACIGGTWQVQSQAIDAAHRMDVWIGTTTASASAVTFHYNETSTATVWSVIEFANVDLGRGYANLIPGITSNIVTNSGTGTALSLSARAAQHATNAMVVLWGIGATGSDEAPEAGWTELSDNGTSAPAVGLTAHWRIGSDTTPTATMSSSNAWVALGIELWGIDGSGDWHAIETFTKADGASVGWGDDQLWVDQQNNGSILSNQATVHSETFPAISMLSNDSSSDNMEARVSAATMVLSGASIIGLRLRAHSSNINAYEFLRVGATSLGGFSVVLRKNIGGVLTYLGGTPTVVPRASLTTPENMYMTVVGSTITCYLNGVQVAAATDTAITGRNRGGLIIECGLAHTDTLADNFQLGDIGKTNSPKLFTGKSDTASSAKTTSNWSKKLVSSGRTANNAFAVLSSRFARMQARIGTSVSARGTGLSTLGEGWSVTRRLIAKIGPSSSAKATLTTHQKVFNTKVSQVVAGGGIFHPAVLDVRAGVQGSEINAVSNAKATLRRNAKMVTKAFGSSATTAHFSGAKSFFTGKAAIATGVFAYLPSRVYFTTRTPIGTFRVFGTEWETAIGTGGFFVPPYYLEGHTTLVKPQFADRLFRHYKARPEGHNVYIYSDGTVSESDPDSYSTMWRESDRHQQTLPNAATVVRIFWGGHDGERVSQEEAALLVAAGYTVRGYHA